MKKKIRRIDSKSSRTAGFTCMYRAASFLEKNELYKSDDYIAPWLLPLLIKFLVKFRLINFRWKFFPKGIYEYVIARTKFIDKIFKDAIKKGIEQIVIFGAGFDSRAIRLNEKNTNIKIFELDSLHTQKEKIQQLKKRNIPISSNTIFIPIDFNIESINEKLKSNAFNQNKVSLFIMEGLIMYLNEKAVDELFKLINKITAPGSMVIFDYIYASVLRKENIYHGENSIYEKMNSINESWLFGIEKGEIEIFLKKYNLKLIENLNSQDLEKKFFKDKNGNIITKINGTHCIVHAKKIVMRHNQTKGLI